MHANVRAALIVYTVLIIVYTLSGFNQAFFTRWNMDIQALMYTVYLINPLAVLESPLFLLAFGTTWAVLIGITIVLLHDYAIMAEAIDEYGQGISWTGNFLEHGLPVIIISLFGYYYMWPLLVHPAYLNTEKLFQAFAAFVTLSLLYALFMDPTNTYMTTMDVPLLSSLILLAFVLALLGLCSLCAWSSRTPISVLRDTASSNHRSWPRAVADTLLCRPRAST